MNILPFPIIIPDDGTECAYPEWVNMMFSISLLAFCGGAAMLLICAVLEFCFDKDTYLTFRIGLIVCVLGAVLLLFSCCALFITGEEIK